MPFKTSVLEDTVEELKRTLTKELCVFYVLSTTKSEAIALATEEINTDGILKHFFFLPPARFHRFRVRVLSGRCQLQNTMKNKRTFQRTFSLVDSS